MIDQQHHQLRVRILHDPVHQNVLAAVLTVVYVKAVVGACEALVHRGWLAPRISRKIIHVAAGSWIVFWPLFAEEHWTWRLNVLVPVVYSLQLFAKGAILKNPNDPDVRTMTRTGSPSELLNGPLLFTLIMTAVGLRLFRTQLGVVVMTCLGFGDGIAPLVGYYFPLGSYPTFPFHNDTNDRKTLSGSMGCFVAAVVGYHALKFVVLLDGGDHEYEYDHDYDNNRFMNNGDDELAMIVRVAAIVAITEGISGSYDNPGIALSAVVAYHYLV